MRKNSLGFTFPTKLMNIPSPTQAMICFSIKKNFPMSYPHVLFFHAIFLSDLGGNMKSGKVGNPSYYWRRLMRADCESLSPPLANLLG